MSVSITSMAASPADSKSIIDTNFSNVKTAVETLQAVPAGSVFGYLTTAAFNTATTTGTVKGGYDFVHLTDAPYDASWTGSAWQFYLKNGIRATPADDSTFSWVNQDTATVSTTNRVVTLTQACGGGDSLRCRRVAVPGSTPYTLTAAVNVHYPQENYASCGLFISDGTKFETLSPSMNSGEGIRFYRFSTYSSYSSLPNTFFRSGFNGMNPLFLKIQNNGTNIIMSMSFDGFTYKQVNSHPKTEFLGSATHVGFYVDGFGANSSDNIYISVLSWELA